MTQFKKGDLVYHAQMSSLRGVVAFVGPPRPLEHADDTKTTARRVFWKGWDPFDPDRIDWTWDFAMRKQDAQDPS